MININSDFKILTKIVNGDGQVLSPLSIDFEFVYTDISNKSIKYIISNKKGTQKNCKSLDDNLILIFENHGFRNFKIKETRHFYIPDSDMQDTFYDLYYDNIIDFKTLSDKAIKVNKNWILQPRDQDIIVPYYKGEPGKSAYQYAKEGGYEGDEQRFYKDLAIDINAIDYINKKIDLNFLEIQKGFTSLDGSPETSTILESLGWDMPFLNKVIDNIRKSLYNSVFIKDGSKGTPACYSLLWNSNTSWTLNIVYFENSILNTITLELRQDTLVYNKSQEELVSKRFLAENSYTKKEADTLLKQKVSIESGKALSSNDYTNEDKQSVGTIKNKQDRLVSGENIKTVNNQSILGSGNIQIEIPKVDLSSYYTKQKIDELLGTKIDKVVGKQLSTEDYTTAEKEKLAGLKNFDDSVLRAMIDGKATKIDVYTKSEADAKFATLEALNSLIDRVSALESKP